MKNLFKRIMAALTAATLAAGSVPLNMTASAQLAPVKVNGHGMLSSVSVTYAAEGCTDWAATTAAADSLPCCRPSGT